MCKYLKEQVLEVKKVLEHLTIIDADYCVLDPIYPLHKLIKTDLDLYLSKEYIESLNGWLILNGWEKTISAQFSGVRYFYFKFVNGFKLKLDISTIYCVYKGHSLYQYKTIPKKIKDINGIVFLHVRDYFNFALKKLQYEQNKKTKIQKLQSLVKQNSELLKEYTNLDINNTLSFDKIIDKHFQNRFNGKINLLNLFKIYYKKILPSKSKINIAFIGMDGAGKGTYKELFKDSLVNSNYLIKDIYLGYSQYQLSLIRFFNEKQQTTNNIMMLQIYRIFFLLLLPFEFIMRRSTGCYDLIIMDRHPDFEPVFPRNSVFNYYNKLLSFIAPNVDRVIFLTGDIDVLWERKKEMSRMQYQNKYNVLKESISLTNPKKIITINTCEGIESSYHNIWTGIKNDL